MTFSVQNRIAGKQAAVAALLLLMTSARGREPRPLYSGLYSQSETEGPEIITACSRFSGRVSAREKKAAVR